MPNLEAGRVSGILAIGPQVLVRPGSVRYSRLPVCRFGDVQRATEVPATARYRSADAGLQAGVQVVGEWEAAEGLEMAVHPVAAD